MDVLDSLLLPLTQEVMTVHCKIETAASIGRESDLDYEESEPWTDLILLLHDEKPLLVHTGEGALREENELTLGEIVVVVLLEESGDRVHVELRGHDVDRDVHSNVEALLNDVLDLSN